MRPVREEPTPFPTLCREGRWEEAADLVRARIADGAYDAAVRMAVEAHAHGGERVSDEAWALLLERGAPAAVDLARALARPDRGVEALAAVMAAGGPGAGLARLRIRANDWRFLERDPGFAALQARWGLEREPVYGSPSADGPVKVRWVTRSDLRLLRATGVGALFLVPLYLVLVPLYPPGLMPLWALALTLLISASTLSVTLVAAVTLPVMHAARSTDGRGPLAGALASALLAAAGVMCAVLGVVRPAPGWLLTAVAGAFLVMFVGRGVRTARWGAPPGPSWWIGAVALIALLNGAEEQHRDASPDVGAGALLVGLAVAALLTRRR